VTDLALEVGNVAKSYGSLVVLSDVSLAVGAAEAVGIVGPNGAGKTTYFNLISGQLRASAGSVWLNGTDITGESAPHRTHRGLGRAFQLTQLFPNLSVLENVRLAVQSKRREGLDLFSVWLDRKETLVRARELVERVRLGDRADARAASLPHGDQRKLSVDDAPVILDLVRALKAERDKTILLVEHKMDVVRELADRIVVLHNGRLVADGDPAEVIASPIVQQAYLGLAPDAEAA